MLFSARYLISPILLTWRSLSEMKDVLSAFVFNTHTHTKPINTFGCLPYPLFCSHHTVQWVNTTLWVAWASRSDWTNCRWVVPLKMGDPVILTKLETVRLASWTRSLVGNTVNLCPQIIQVPTLDTPKLWTTCSF